MSRAGGGPSGDEVLASVPADLLDLDPELLRELGHWVVDRTVEHLATLRDRPALTTAPAADLEAVLGGPVPRGPAPLQEGLELLADVALEHQQHGDHPRYFARVPGPSSPVAVLGEWLATGLQSIASSWAGGSGPSALELISLGWLRDALELPAGSEGVLVSGGSMASTTALAVARRAQGGGPLYVSDQTHSSIVRGARALGFDDDGIRVLPTGHDLRLAPAVLEHAVAADLAAGLRPGTVVATAGTTNTGAIDPIPAIAAVARRHGLWLHVDGAYGGPAALATGRHGIDGLGLVDSFALDPHKWLFQPYDIACLWVARPGELDATFGMHPEYLADVQGGAFDLHNRGLELTRRARGAKLWLTLRTYGLDTLAAAVERGIALAEHAQQAVEADPRLEVVTPAQLGVVTFTGPAAGSGRLAAAAAAVTADGLAAVSTTVLHGRTVLRLCTINPRTTPDDLDLTVAALADALERPA